MTRMMETLEDIFNIRIPEISGNRLFTLGTRVPRKYESEWLEWPWRALVSQGAGGYYMARAHEWAPPPIARII